jgi:hypothetical protein
MFIISIDYDSTLFSGSYPERGEPIKEVIDKVKEFQENEFCESILWTCREGKSLEEAIERCKEQGLRFTSINENTPYEKEYIKRKQEQGEDTFAQRKVYADVYVDDKAPGSIDYFLKINVKKTCESFKDRKDEL